MLTVGVDLAAEPRGTALAEVVWRAGGATVTALSMDVTNELIAEASERADKVGIDCAFGWPDEFVEFVVARSAGELLEPSADHGMDWRRRLSYRDTDRDIRERTGRTPLSVATDRLGLTAMRCAVILDDLTGRGLDASRDGSGLVVEAYPAAALGVWGVSVRGSKREPDVLLELVDGLVAAAPWLSVGEFLPLMRASHDAFDAVIAALIARSSALGHTASPPALSAARAMREGWIALPAGPLARLVAPPA